MLSEQPPPPNAVNGRHAAKRTLTRSSHVHRHPSYPSRVEAGKLLAKVLNYYAGQPDALVLSIKPSAIPLANEVAKILKLPLDLLLIRPLKVEGLTVGAINNRCDQVLLKDKIVRGCDILQETIDECIDQERKELTTQQQLYTPRNLPLPSSERATLILATDGIHTGQNARHAIQMLRIMGYYGKIVLVAGVISSDAQQRFRVMCDSVIALSSPQIVGTVESWFDDKEINAEGVRAVLVRG